MKIYSEIRQSAYNALTANWKPAVLATLILACVYIVIYGIGYCGGQNGSATLSFITFVLNICIFVPLLFIFKIAMLGFYNGYADDTVKNMLDTFKTKYSRYLVLSLLIAVYTFLWGLLLIIPGIIKSYAYAMTPYIAAENPELGAEECINRSMKMMYGHKWELFVLDLTFIGWYLLIIVTCGIASLFVAPYTELARVEFYKELKSEPQIVEAQEV